MSRPNILLQLSASVNTSCSATNVCHLLNILYINDRPTCGSDNSVLQHHIYESSIFFVFVIVFTTSERTTKAIANGQARNLLKLHKLQSLLCFFSCFFFSPFTYRGFVMAKLPVRERNLGAIII